MCVNLAKLDEVPKCCQKSPPFPIFLCIHRCYATCMSKKSLITGTIKLTKMDIPFAINHEKHIENGE